MIDESGWGLAVMGLASVAAGLVNALAGGGTLITFPAMTALGIPALTANITNTVALCPGYFGATLAQSKDLHGQNKRIGLLTPVAALGGIAGASLLLLTDERLFRSLVPFLILLASILLALQEPIRKWVVRRSKRDAPKTAAEKWPLLPIGLAAIYGGYFGAGLSVIILAVLGLMIEDSLTRLNALKQALAFAINVAAALFLIFSGKVLWSAAALMAVGALCGGALGGRLAGRISASTLRWIVVAIGAATATVYLVFP